MYYINDKCQTKSSVSNQNWLTNFVPSVRFPHT